MSTEAESALAELGRAISRAAHALAAVPGDDDVTAYKCARVLDAAFGDLAGLLETVPGIVGAGDPGRAVSGRLERSRAELAARREEVAAHRARLDELSGSEQSLRDVTAEDTRLRGRIDELERASRLAAEIPGLRARTTALEEAVAAAGVADAPDIATRIAEAARRFTALTAAQRDAVSAAAERLIAEAETAARELSEQQARRESAAADLTRMESDAARLAKEHSEMLPVLAAWSQADHDVADGLRAAGFGTGQAGSPLSTVLGELDGIRGRLAGLDETLRRLLADHAKTYEDVRRSRPLLRSAAGTVGCQHGQPGCSRARLSLPAVLEFPGSSAAARW